MSFTTTTVTLLSLLLLIVGFVTLSEPRRRSLTWSSVRRALRWEFWPMSIFYVPIVLYIVGLAIRFRGLSFTAANPGLPHSGVIGEHKGLGLDKVLRSDPGAVAPFELIPMSLSISDRIQRAEEFMSGLGLSYPVILKPDFGQRGVGVQVIRSHQHLEQYLTDMVVDTLIQAHVAGEEFGVFYYRLPNEKTGKIFSITHKCFPVLIGDGASNLEQLILGDARTHYMARFLLQLHQDRLGHILAKDEQFQVVEIGSHCRGSLFLDGQAYLTPELESRIDTICQSIPGFYFGRFDIRVPSIEAFQAGRDLKIIEINGVTSEATHIYDPKHSVIYGWSTLFKQWQLAFAIGQQNMANGHATVSIPKLIKLVKIMNKEA